MKAQVTILGGLLAVGCLAQDEPPFVGRWITPDEIVRLDFELRPGFLTEGSFWKNAIGGGTIGVWTIVEDSLEIFSHDQDALVSSEVHYVDPPVVERYSYRMVSDTLVIGRNTISVAFVPRHICDRIGFLQREGVVAEYVVSVTIRPEMGGDLIAELNAAAANQATVTGVETFDVVGAAHGLTLIEKSSLRENLFRLHFPVTTEIQTVSRDYCGLEDVEGVFSVPLIETSVVHNSWGMLKQSTPQTRSADR